MSDFSWVEKMQSSSISLRFLRYKHSRCLDSSTSITGSVICKRCIDIKIWDCLFFIRRYLCYICHSRTFQENIECLRSYTQFRIIFFCIDLTCLIHHVFFQMVFGKQLFVKYVRVKGVVLEP